MKQTTKNGVVLLAAGLAVSGFVNHGEWDLANVVSPPGQEEAVSRTQVPSLVFSVTKEKREDEGESTLAQAIDGGQPLRLQLPGREPLDFLFRDFPLLADGYCTTLGKADRHDVRLRVFEGRAIAAGQVHTATLALADRSAAGVVRLANGVQVQLRGVDGGLFESLTILHSELACVRDPRTGSYRTMSLNGDLAKPDWSQAEPAKFKPTEDFPAMASSGVNPVNGAPTLVLGSPASPPLYEASLKVATVIVALDKSATGLNSKNHLTEVTSRYLALMANVAAIYENQLGVRLLVQELILTPDSGDYDDIPFDSNGDTLDDFATWTQRWRPESTYGQTASIRFGDGLSGGILGIAFQNGLHTRNGVSVMQAGFGWALTSHEVGHIFGSGHSIGGIMNPQYSTKLRSFFNDIEGQEFTAASQIYGRSSGLLSGPAAMRNPAEMPFAVDDVAWAAPGERIHYDVLANDLNQVYRGQQNSLSLAEVGQVTPRYAGSVATEAGRAVFTPSDGFEGTAWFSYSMQGDAGRGWLHKGDVAVVVGDPEGNAFEMDVAAGQSRTLKLPGDGSISQVRSPKQSLLHETISSSSVYVLRVSADATGSEKIQYRAGGKRQTLKLNYINEPPVAEPDVLYLSAGDSVSFNPLTNDHAAGLRGAFKTEPVIAVGTNGEGSEGQDYFPGGFRLFSVRSKATNLGSLFVHRSPVMRDGRRRNEPNGLLTFKVKNSANGAGLIEYTIEDALGQRAIGTVQVIVTGTSDIMVGSGDYVRGWVPTNGRHDDSWTTIDFNDATWKRGLKGAGYERRSGYESLISSALNFSTQMYNKTESLYLRYAFNVNDPGVIDDLKLRMKYDDGFVAYLNGKRVASANAPPTTQWNSGATTTHNDTLAKQFELFDITVHRDQLLPGKNVLAIHGLNGGLTSSDMLIIAEVVSTDRGKSLLPEIVCAPPVERTTESLTLAGHLAHSQPGTKAFFVWGKTDGGPDVTKWDHSTQVTPDGDGQLRHLVDGLAVDSTLYYRLLAKNKIGTAWSGDTQKTSTLPQGMLVARADQFAVAPGRTLSLAKREEGVLANDVGVLPVTEVQLLAKPQHGKLAFRSDGTFDYTPNKTFTGTDRFLYRLLKVVAAQEQILVSVGGDWRYYDGSTAPNRNWTKLSFDDSAWLSGPGLFGYGNGNEATIVSYGTNPNRKRATVYFRQTFEVDAVELIEKMTFKLLRDDAAAVYVNGEQVYRDSNLLQTARHTTYATSTIVDESAYATFEVVGGSLTNGKNVVAAEVHQASRTSSDLSFALFGKAHMFPGARVTLKEELSNNTNDIISLNVKVSPFTIFLDSKIQKKYIVETSTNLSDWVQLRVISGNGDSIEFKPTPRPNEKARFFRIRLNR